MDYIATFYVTYGIIASLLVIAMGGQLWIIRNA